MNIQIKCYYCDGRGYYRILRMVKCCRSRKCSNCFGLEKMFINVEYRCNECEGYGIICHAFETFL